MADRKEIENALTDQIATVLGLAEEEVKPQTPLESIGIDSIRLIEILIFIEKKYGIRLMDAGLDRESFRNASSLAGAVIAEMKKSDTQ